MSHSTSLKGDINNNGRIDSDREEKANIEFNAKDIQGLQNELSKLKRRMNVSPISNRQNEFASSAKIAEELTDGKQRVYFNNVGKSVVFKNGNKQMSSCVQIGTNDNSISNVEHIHFNNGSTLKGLVNEKQEWLNLSLAEQHYFVPSLYFLQIFYLYH